MSSSDGTEMENYQVQEIVCHTKSSEQLLSQTARQSKPKLDHLRLSTESPDQQKDDMVNGCPKLWVSRCITVGIPGCGTSLVVVNSVWFSDILVCPQIQAVKCVLLCCQQLIYSDALTVCLYDV